MALHAWRYLVIDRIHISVGIGSKELHGFAVSQLKGLKDIQNDLVPNGKITLSLNDYVTRLNYYPTKKLKAAEIAVGVTKSKHCYFRLGLYPAKFQKGQFEHFKKMLGDLLPDFCYPKLFETGRVSYVEWAVDSLSHAAHSFIPFRAKCSCSSIFIDQQGTMGSTYIGSAKSTQYHCIYDKTKQQLEKNLVPAYKMQTRIEARCRHIGLSPSELVMEMGNPFASLEVADLRAARKVSNDSAWQKFLDRSLEVGSAGAFAPQSKYQRMKFMTMLRGAAAPWWNPANVWKDVPRAMDTIAP